MTSTINLMMTHLNNRVFPHYNNYSRSTLLSVHSFQVEGVIINVLLF